MLRSTDEIEQILGVLTQCISTHKITLLRFYFERDLTEIS